MSQTGAQAASSPAAAGAQLTTAALEDTMYEMLAVGLDPCESRVTQKEIQQFLFEHARSPKSIEEFLSFFRTHNLPTDPESEAAVWAAVARLRGRVTVLAISHQVGVTAVADRVYRIEDGRAVEEPS